MQWYEHLAEHLFLLLVVWALVRAGKPKRRTRTTTPKGKPREVRLPKRAIESIPPVTVAWLLQTFLRR